MEVLSYKKNYESVSLANAIFKQNLDKRQQVHHYYLLDKRVLFFCSQQFLLKESSFSLFSFFPDEVRRKQEN